MRRLLIGLWVLMAAPAVAQDMSFALVGNGGNCNGCGWTAAEGTITAETPERFKAYLAENEGYCAAVTFNSPGGDLAAAVRLGRMIREAGCSTNVGGSDPEPGTPWFFLEPGRCESACAFAYMGGTARFFDRETLAGNVQGNLLGVHQFFRREGGALPSAATQAIMGQLLLYVLDMGIDPEVLAVASRTPAGGMHHFTPGELEQLGLITEGGRTQMEFVLEGDGLAVTWEDLGLSGNTARRAHLYCDRTRRAWILRVAEFEGARASLGFRPEAPEEMFLKVADTSYRFAPSDILTIEQGEEAWLLEVRLPVDLSKRAGAAFFFQTSGARNWFYHLSAEGTLPDRQIMGVLRRTCVS